MNPAVIKAFYHRTRKTSVPWTTQEIATRLKIPFDEAIKTLCAHAQMGFTTAERKNRKTGNAVWMLTKSGQEQVRMMIKAEELVKK
jgi:hypothetical protein